MKMIRNDWKLDELQELYSLPLFELISKAHLLHREFHSLGEVQLCMLISIKTGGCSEDCKYCAQSSRYQTFVKAQPLMDIEQVLSKANKAKERGISRICLGVAWREIRDNKQFDAIIHMVKGIKELGLEVCCTLGMLNGMQARKLKQAGLYAYNHNLDTSEKYYSKIITTRTYQDRLNTLKNIEQAELSVCCGGILGMGETIQDRLELIQSLANRSPQPESVPINRLEPIQGTALGHLEKINVWELLKIVAIARITMPRSLIRLSAGRLGMNEAEHGLAFFAGANSIHCGETLLTVPNAPLHQDEKLFELWGLSKRPAYKKSESK